MKQTYTKRTYGWGDLRVLRMGNAFTCIIHPENLDALNRGEAFTDEQGCRWVPEIENDLVTLRSGNHRFNISLSELNA
jgi:gluconate kinase